MYIRQTAEAESRRKSPSSFVSETSSILAGPLTRCLVVEEVLQFGRDYLRDRDRGSDLPVSLDIDLWLSTVSLPNRFGTLEIPRAVLGTSGCKAVGALSSSFSEVSSFVPDGREWRVRLGSRQSRRLVPRGVERPRFRRGHRFRARRRRRRRRRKTREGEERGRSRGRRVHGRRQDVVRSPTRSRGSRRRGVCGTRRYGRRGRARYRDGGDLERRERRKRGARLRNGSPVDWSDPRCREAVRRNARRRLGRSEKRRSR